MTRTARLAFALAPAFVLATALATVAANDAHHMPSAAPQAATEGGQAAFAAIAEIVALLDADPATDWSRVDIEGLRRHLIDMDAVTIGAEVTAVRLANTWRFEATGTPQTRAALQRMTRAHADAMGGVNGWTLTAETTPTGAALIVAAPDATGATKIGALGLIGVLTLGMHHQAHHMALARGTLAHD